MTDELKLNQMRMNQLADLWQLGEEKEIPTPSDRLEETPGDMPTIDGYRILDKLGEGGMGTVWRAEQLSTHREVALKIMRVHTFGSSRTPERFEREVDMAARLQHPHIARVYDSGLHQGLYYYVMELIEGVTLQEYVRVKNLNAHQIIGVLKTVADAVHYAHQRRVIHRDLKPGNIMVADDGRPYVLDFGLAKPTEKEQHSHTVSLRGEVLGTLNYMAPEQLSGHPEDIDIRSDIFAIGVIAYQLLTGHFPFGEHLTTAELIVKLQNDDPVLPRRHVPGMDRDLEAIILKALARKPADRYQSVAELTTDIDNWFANRPVIARTADRMYLIEKWIARNRASSIILCLLLVILLGSSFISLFFYRRSAEAYRHLQQAQAETLASYNQLYDNANKVMLDTFLMLWETGQKDRARLYLTFLDNHTREHAAITFFLDEAPYAQKAKAFHQAVGKKHEGFYYFIAGEYQRLHGRPGQALEAYRQSLQMDRQSSQPDRWTIKQIQLRLNNYENAKTKL